jgi:hypothetical protein
MEQPPNYRREFAKSPHHLWLGLLTLGAGFLSATPLGLILGGTAFALGWIYLPDLHLFKRWVNRRHEEAARVAALAQVADFVKRRETILASLSRSRRERYGALAEVCQNIESASADNPMATGDPAADPRLRKLDELMWTYLRLLSIEESLERFLQTEQDEDVPSLVQEAEKEVSDLGAEIDALKAKGGSMTLDAKQRLLGSRRERLEVLRKRLQRIDQAHANLALVVSEQERLDQQIKLIRADAVATKNAQTLTARIDATVEHLDQTNKWIAELDEFKDLVGDLPPTGFRLGYETPARVTESRIPVPPPLPEPPRTERRSRAGLRGR